MKLLQWHIYLYVYNPNNVCPHSFSPGQTTEKVSLAQGLATRKTDHSVSYLKAKPKSEARTLAVQHGHRVALGFQSSKQKASQEQRRRLFSTVIAERLPRNGQAELWLYPDEGGTAQCKFLQKWHELCSLSHLLHNGVCWLSAHTSSGHRSLARHQSQKRPVRRPQSTQG